MLICRICGHALDDDAGFCNKCGSKIEPGKTIPDLSLEESTELVETLLNKYAELENLESEITACEEKLSRSSGMPRSGVSMMHYFWMFILATLVAVQVCLFLLFACNIRDNFPWPVVRNCFFISIPIGIFVFGLIYSIRKSRAVNNGIAKLIMEDQNKRIELRNHLSGLKSRLDELKTEISDYNRNIPEKYKSADCISRIKTLLLTGRASSLYGAIALLRK